jgi:hypothetical protein
MTGQNYVAHYNKLVSILHYIEYFITGIFTLDLFIHFMSHKHKLAFIFNITTIIDILAVLPVYLSFTVVDIESQLGFLHIL